jgi:hypothetical protein
MPAGIISAPDGGAESFYVESVAAAIKADACRALPGARWGSEDVRNVCFGRQEENF